MTVSGVVGIRVVFIVVILLGGCIRVLVPPHNYPWHLRPPLVYLPPLWVGVGYGYG